MPPPLHKLVPIKFFEIPAAMSWPHYIVATFLKEPLRIWISLLPKFPFLWKLTQSRQVRRNQGVQGDFIAPSLQIFAKFDVKPVIPNGGFHLHLLVFPFVYQFNSRIGFLKYGSEEKGSWLCICFILLGFIMSKKLRGLWFYLLIKVQNATSLVFLT